MNFMEFACRGIVRNEDNIRLLSKHMVKLAKCNNMHNTAIKGLCFAGIGLCCIIAAQGQEIKALQKQVKDLDRQLNIQEELKEQKGA